MERLDKLVASRMCISRKDAKGLIYRGLVTVNGAVAKGPEQKCSETDQVAAEGTSLQLAAFVYIMMNKPKDVVCATRDNKEQTVLDLLPDNLRRKGLFPAGRLDKDTEGFVLITDDGAFSHRILSPKRHVPKTYQARLDQPVDMALLTGYFGKEMDLGGGDKTSPAKIRLLEEGEQPLVEVVIYEGVYHQVKRMFAKCGLEVLSLRRVKIGGLCLDEGLALGESRLLTPEEILQIEKVEQAANNW